MRSWLCLWCHYLLWPTETWNLLVLYDGNGKMLVMATSSMPLFSKGSQARTNQNARMIHFVMLSTNKFHVTVLLSRDRSQMTSNEVVTKSGTRGAAKCVTDVPVPMWLHYEYSIRRASKQTNHWEKKMLREVLEMYFSSVPLMEHERRIDVTPRASRGVLTLIVFTSATDFAKKEGLRVVYILVSSVIYL